MIMQNTAMLKDDNNILKFDLKGSLVNRKTKVP